jgi:hypothetical protein
MAECALKAERKFAKKGRWVDISSCVCMSFSGGNMFKERIIRIRRDQENPLTDAVGQGQGSESCGEFGLWGRFPSGRCEYLL